MFQRSAWRGASPIDFVIIAAFCYPAIVAAFDAALGLPEQVFPLLLLVFTALIASAAIVLIDRRTFVSYRGTAPLFLALFLVVAAAATLRADLSEFRWDAPAMWRQLFLAMTPALLFWAGRAWAARRFSPRAIDFGVNILLAVCGSSILLEMGGFASFEVFGSRFFGFLGDQVAWLLSFVAVYLLCRGRVALFGFSILLLLVTQSRGPLVIVAVAIGLYFLFSKSVDTRTQLLRIATLVAALIAIIAAQQFFDAFLARLSSESLLENDRTRTIAFTLDVFELRPVFGSGYNAHTYYFLPRSAFVNYTFTQWATPVSTWAQVLADSGVLGFIPFVLWAIICSVVAIRALRLPSGTEEARALAGLAAWIIPFLMINHTAAWLLPASMTSPILFTAAGVVVGRMTAVRPATHFQAGHPESVREVVRQPT